MTELYYTIALMLMSYTNRWEADQEIGASGLMQLEVHRTWGEAFRYLEDTAGNLFSVRRSGEQKRAAGVIDRICIYIEENLDQDLSLVRLADVIHFNPSYLSRLFKQERGINLSEYIEELRVRQAKEAAAQRGAEGRRGRLADRLRHPAILHAGLQKVDRNHAAGIPCGCGWGLNG